MNAPTIENMVRTDGKAYQVKQSPWLGRFVITAVAAAIVALPLYILTTEISYSAYPSQIHEPWSSINSIWSNPGFSMLVVCICAGIALIFSHQTGSFAKSSSPQRRNILAAIAVFSPTAVITIVALIYAIKDALNGGFRIPLGTKLFWAMMWTFLWITPWFAYIYIFRLGMSRCIDRASAIILYVFGILLLIALTYPLARWLGNNDGDMQEVLAIAETVTLSVLISAGLADIVLWGKEDRTANHAKRVTSERE